MYVYIYILKYWFKMLKKKKKEDEIQRLTRAALHTNLALQRSNIVCLPSFFGFVRMAISEPKNGKDCVGAHIRIARYGGVVTTVVSEQLFNSSTHEYSYEHQYCCSVATRALMRGSKDKARTAPM